MVLQKNLHIPSRKRKQAAMTGAGEEEQPEAAEEGQPQAAE